MKNTSENKAKFFAQYWGQKIFKDGLKEGRVESISKEIFEPRVSLSVLKLYEIGHLELKPLSQISDEDASTVMYGRTHEELKAYYHGDLHWFEKDVYKNLEWADYLRSKGYALNWNGITVDEMIEFGWVKLKTD